MRKLLPYIGQGLLVGLAGGAIAVLLLWGRSGPQQAKVEFVEAPHAPMAQAQGAAPASYAPAVKRAAPSVVNIHTSKTVTRANHPLLDDPAFRRFFGDALPPQQSQQTSLGSGVIVSASGYIITNNHVIDGADEIDVGLQDGRHASARLVGTDPETDIAILKTDLGTLTPMVLGHSDLLQVGDVVLAIGDPFGVGQTVTQGIISATGRSELGLSTFENFIQTDAAINPGNSGGALVNAGGELIGINTAIFSRSGGSEGIGFAIPVNLAKDVMTQLIKSGQVTRSWLGIEIQELTPPLAESFGVPPGKGVVVARILRDGPADKAGLETGDIITEVAGAAVTTLRDTLQKIASQAPGKKIELKVLRSGKSKTLTATVTQRPKPEPQQQDSSRP
ncbi:MAG: Do family serine endopeptidase [Gammaproteobacteria bacterium]|nr:Do family serine endopeptidase [Gammaproteobacteria bacterium]